MEEKKEREEERRREKDRGRRKDLCVGEDGRKDSWVVDAEDEFADKGRGGIGEGAKVEDNTFSLLWC